MKVHCLIIISLIISVVHNSDYEYLSLNKPYTLKTGEKSLKFYQVSLREMKSLPSDIKIETQISQNEDEIKRLEKLALSDEVGTDFEKAVEISKQIDALKAQNEQLFNEWEQLQIAESEE